MAGRLMIVDGNSIVNRAFYGIRMLTTKDNVPTNAVYGFLNILLKYLDELDPSYVCVAFDTPAPTFRHQKFADYKATRKGMPDELAVQMPILKQVLSAMNIAMLELDGYEADDIIGTVAERCVQAGIECNIVTGDKDDLQLASQSTKIYLTTTRQGRTQTDVYNAAAVEERFGITPQQMIDVKALMGDPSDNVPGVMGIGEKTALALITKNKSIEAVYENLQDCGIKGAALKKLEAGKEMAFLSKQLVTIDKNVPIEFSFESVRRKPYDGPRLFRELSALEFKSIIQRLNLAPDEPAGQGGQDGAESDPFENRVCELIESERELLELAKKISAAGEFTYRIYSHGGQLSAVAVAAGEYAALAVVGLALSVQAILDILGPLFADKTIKKTGHGLREDIVLLNGYGVKLDGISFDTAIGAYILDPSRANYSLSELADFMLGIRLKSESDVLGKGAKAASIADIDSKTALKFACREAFVVDFLREAIREELKTNQQEYLYYEVEMPLIQTLADMQIAGIAVDRERLWQFAGELSERIEKISAQIYSLAGYEFNINSTKQLGEVLFEKLGLPVIKRTKTGYSTDSAVLEKLKGSHPVIELLLEYRLISKIKSTYADGLLNVINPDTGRIHSSFHQTVTVTGRISSTEPNMQNIPVRHPLGREIRRMFVAGGEDTFLVDADYSQIELRILAHISGDPAMRKAFLRGDDIHTITASQVLNIAPEDVTPQQRDAAKAVNFGIVYGIGEFSLSKDLGISVSEARAYIDSYLGHYSGVREYMARIKQQAKETGYVTTLLGRRRYIPELRSSNHNLRAFGERVALNTPIQGSAADIIKLAMVRVHRRLSEGGYRSRLVLQVHDELIVEAHKDELDEVCAILKHEMEHAIELDVPLVVDQKWGKSWYDAK